MPTIELTPGIVIDQSELAFSFARAGGPGGQNVNKVETACNCASTLAIRRLSTKR